MTERKTTWKFRRPTEEDIRFVIEHMRTEDKRELKRLTGLDEEWGLRHSIEDSDTCYAAELSCGEVCSIFGGTRVNVMDSIGVIWSLSTDVVNRSRVEFAIASREAIDLVFREMSDVEEFRNFVDTDYKSAMRWIEWLGGTFSINTWKPGACGGIFRQFYIENPHYKGGL